MAVKPVVYDDTTKKHRPLGSGEKMDGLSASSVISSQSGNLIATGSDGLAYATGSGIADPAADNLLEATSGGKLKVDMDRIVEWIDGHSSDASALASAIGVVSDDSGNVIVEGTDSGAFLSKAALASAIGSMDGAQLQALASAIADGDTIVASSGKLVVDPTNATAAKLKKITAVLPKAQGGIAVDSSTGKMYVDFDAMSADTKRSIVLSMVDLDGGLAVHDSGAKKGTIYVDFTSMDPAIMRAVVLNMVQQGGGLAVDQNGQLYVDFDSMPTDKFEAMLKSLKMLVPLDANKTLYVSTNNSAAGDTIIDGRGTAAKPFKTIQACVNYATSTYSVGNYSIYIRVVAGTYNECVALPDFSRGTGHIGIVSDSGSLDVIVRAVARASDGATTWCFNANGGVWRLQHIRMVRVESPTSGYGQAWGCVQATGTAVVHLFGNSYEQSFPASSALGGNNYTVRVINADGGGRIDLQHDVLASSISTHVYEGSVGSFAVHVLCAERGGSIFLRGVYDDQNNPVTTGEYACSGSHDVFLREFQVGSLNTLGGGTLTYFTGSMAGKRYSLTGGSYAAGGLGADFFPGDEAGTVESSTYCWYA